jgi:hypothetical protein
VIAVMLQSGRFLAQDTLSAGKKDTVKTHWSGSFKVEGSYQKGNTNKILGMMKGEVKRTDRVLESILTGKIVYGESDDVKDENDFYSSFTMDLFYNRMFSPFLLQLTEFSFGREIDLRSQSGAGLKYTFVNIPEIKASISAAGIFDYTNLREKPGNNDSRTWRLSARLKFTLTLFNSSLILAHATFYQPSYKHLKNAIWRSDTELALPLTTFLFVSSTYSYIHEDVVPAGVKKDDHMLTFGLGVNFK